MSSSRDTLPQSLRLNEDGEFEDQFGNIDQQVDTDEYISNFEFSVPRETNVSDEFLKIGVGKGATGTDGISDVPKLGNHFGTVEEHEDLDTAIRDFKTSIARDSKNNFLNDFANLGNNRGAIDGISQRPKARLGRKKSVNRGLRSSTLRSSFKGELTNLKETQEILDSPTSVSSMGGSDVINRRLRFSTGSNAKSMRGLLGMNDFDDLIDDDNDDEQPCISAESEDEGFIMDAVIESHYAPEDMRCLALVAHNHMKPAMRKFVLANKNLLCKFQLTGTNTTMTMLKEVFGDDHTVKYGPTCTSGPLGGDAELVAIMCTENLGGCVFFQDPMSCHPHSADIECLTRQANVHNILMMSNPATAYACMMTLRFALEKGHAELIPSFFQTLASPSVAEYKTRQAQVIKKNSTRKVKKNGTRKV